MRGTEGGPHNIASQPLFTIKQESPSHIFLFFFLQHFEFSEMLFGIVQLRTTTLIIIIIMQSDLITLIQPEILAEKLRDLPRTTFAWIHLESNYDSSMKKKNNPFHGKGLRKISKQAVVMGFDYEKAMNRRIEKLGQEPNYKAKPRTWGEKEGKALIVYNDSFYVEMQSISTYEKKYILPCGKEVDEAEIEPFKNAKGKKEGLEEKSPEELAEMSEEDIKKFILDNQLAYRNPKFESIKEIHFEGKKFRLMWHAPKDARSSMELPRNEAEEVVTSFVELAKHHRLQLGLQV